MRFYGKLNFKDAANALREADFNSLPGQAVQLTMAPELRKDQIRNMGIGQEAVESSIMILVYPDEKDHAHLVLIQRAVYDGVHSGQIAFPGGRRDPGDRDLLETALRETREEIGIEPQQIEIAGMLTDLYIPPSNFLVTPFAGIISDRPLFKPDPVEVNQVIEVALYEFLSGKIKTEHTIRLSGGISVLTPCYKTNGHIIWGATAMILAEFLSVLNQGLDVIR